MFYNISAQIQPDNSHRSRPGTAGRPSNNRGRPLLLAVEDNRTTQDRDKGQRNKKGIEKRTKKENEKGVKRE